MSGADLGGVLGEGDIADEVEPVLDGPLRADDARELVRGGLSAGQVRDDVDSLAGALAGPDVGAVPGDLGDLRGVWEVDTEIGEGQDLDDAVS
ncbi:hypothetical protein [Streptomyces sirii]|uniref:hypothetical protein n=1 Tax=Streptomyces sirii TaxID=3127701 RepID=UPI003D364421